MESIGAVKVQVVDSVEAYVELMKEIFDFDLLRGFLSTFPVVINSMHGGLNEMKLKSTRFLAF